MRRVRAIGNIRNMGLRRIDALHTEVGETHSPFRCRSALVVDLPGQSPFRPAVCILATLPMGDWQVFLRRPSKFWMEVARLVRTKK